LIRPYLENPKILKVGAGIWTYDYHVFMNYGIRLQNVEDILDMSRWCNSSTLFGHSLKAWCNRLGIHQEGFKALTTVLEYAPGNVRLVRTTQGCNARPWPVSYYPGPIYKLRYKRLSIQELWEQYPDRRERIKQYALQDAVAGLVVHDHLKRKLQELSR
jgi:hypothetical protein